MADIVPLRPSEHDTVQQLLPWHVNGTLSADEAARVEAHLAECESCRLDLARERELAREVALLPLDVDEGWQALAMRLPLALSSPARVPSFSRSGPVGWAVGGALAASLVLGVAIVGLQRSPDPAPTFHTLGSPAGAASGQAIVLFRPDATERQMRAILMAQGARVIDGPTAAGAYVVRFDGRSPADAISALRQSGEVVLAEPIASDGRP
ncbi:MAG TPA: zf-HC2 domain-containing protein [Croceibacterium sp.]|nr:zf-HC2 domain-containing protein [Croceibacterium sp.]